MNELDDIWNVTDDDAKLGIRYPLTGGGNFLRFRDRHKDDIRYNEDTGQWISFDSVKGWLKVDRREIVTLADKIVDSIAEEANDASNDGKIKILNWWKKSQERFRLDDIIKMAQDRSPFNITNKDTNTDAGFINCSNGIVDLKTGFLKPYTRSNITLNRVNVAYNPLADWDESEWKKFFDTVLVDSENKPDKNYHRFVKKVLGYAIAGENKEHKLFIAFGGGRNGKRTLFENLMKILSKDYCNAIPFETFLQRDATDARKLEAIGRLKDLRIAISSEANKDRRFDEALVKNVTGGDTLTGTILHKGSKEFEPTHTIFLQTNDLPKFRDFSLGMRERLCVLPFNATFDGNTRDLHIDKRLMTNKEKESLFNFIVQGAVAWYQDKGLGQFPDIVKEATEDYINSNDIIGKFIEEAMIKDDGKNVSNLDVFERYEQWCQKSGEYVQAIQKLPIYLEERGIKNKKTNAGKVYVGYRLRLIGEGH